jgi:hypothetical protein
MQCIACGFDLSRELRNMNVSVRACVVRACVRVYVRSRICA